MSSQKTQADTPVEDSRQRPETRKLFKRAILIAAMVLVAFFGIFAAARGYQYAVSPAVIRQPSVDHYHFRTQLLYNGQAVNFADQQYQETYAAGQCSALLPETPIHFHDNTDQMTHIHWNGMTGGMMLKYYGLNLIGGPEGMLGYRFDSGGYLNPEAVPILTDTLPDVPEGHDIYVFMKTADGFKEKPASEFLEQDLEVFFEQQSNLGALGSSWLDMLLPKASAHAGEDHSPVEQQPTGTSPTADEADLQELNNLIGDVAIYIQPERPTDEQVRQAFNNLIELPQTTCGG